MLKIRYRKSEIQQRSNFDKVALSHMEGLAEGSRLRARFYLEGLGEVDTFLTSTSICCRLGSECSSDDGKFCMGFSAASEAPQEILLSNIYAAKLFSNGSSHMATSPTLRCYTTSRNLQKLGAVQMHRFVVYFIERSHNQKSAWIQKTVTFGHPEQKTCEEWVECICKFLNDDKSRPKNLLVFVNPMSGKGQAVKIWRMVCPFFDLAKIGTKVVKTQRAGHAFQVMKEISDEDLRCFDGVVTVGGDGFFNEVLNGILSWRHKASFPPSPDDVKQHTHSLSNHFHCRDGTEDKHTLFEASEVQIVKASNQSNSVPFASDNDSHPFLHDVDASKLEGSSVGLYKERSKYGDLTSPPKSFQKVNQPYHSSCTKMGTEDEASDVKSGTEKTAGEISSMFSFPHPSFRFGIIPAGSTDTIVVSTTSVRDPVTSALQIILGKRLPLDIAQVVSWQGSSKSFVETPCVRYMASFSGYGFYGDVIKESEAYRWMGPARYDYAGTKVFLRHRSYNAEVAFVKMANDVSCSGNRESLNDGKCISNCPYCANGVITQEHEMQSKHQTPIWFQTKGTFLSVGAAVMSCRNDKAPDGLVANAHLADGFLHLILIKDCSHASYLRHLLRLTRKGADPLDFDFVEHHKTTAFTFVSHGVESLWNVDGELLPGHKLSAQVFRGLISLFAEGPAF